jgi:hypothetical protein
MITIQRLRWSLGRDKTVVPSGWQATNAGNREPRLRLLALLSMWLGTKAGAEATATAHRTGWMVHV